MRLKVRIIHGVQDQAQFLISLQIHSDMISGPRLTQQACLSFRDLSGMKKFVEKGEINHALRFTVRNTRNAFIHPATHAASNSSNINYPPMGMRIRLKTGFDITGFSPHIQVILRALKKYGMFVADNGSDWYISGAPDSRWDDEELGELKTIQGKNFEVVKSGTVIQMTK